MKAPPPVAMTRGPFRQQPRHDAALAVAKIRLAVARKDLWDRHSGGQFDFRVEIDELQTQPLRQPAADRRLAGAHDADEHDRSPVQGCDHRLGAGVAGAIPAVPPPLLLFHCSFSCCNTPKGQI